MNHAHQGVPAQAKQRERGWIEDDSGHERGPVSLPDDRAHVIDGSPLPENRESNANRHQENDGRWHLPEPPEQPSNPGTRYRIRRRAWLIPIR
jgi:hypothetical protein